MTTIHPATTRKASRYGIELIDQGDYVKAVKGLDFVSDEDPKAAVNALIAITAFTSEYAVRVIQSEAGFTAYHSDDTETPICDPMSDVFELIAWLGEKAEEIGLVEVVEERTRSSVVPAIYQERYKQNPRGVDCGDPLSDVLYEETHEGGNFNRERFGEILHLNHVDCTGRWFDAVNNGLFRMTGRNKLRTAIAISGKLVLPEGREVSRQELGIEAKTPKGKKAEAEAEAEAEADES